MRLKRVEATGSGLRRVSSYYKTRNLELIIEALSSSFVVRIPSITIDEVVFLNLFCYNI